MTPYRSPGAAPAGGGIVLVVVPGLAAPARSFVVFLAPPGARPAVSRGLLDVLVFVLFRLRTAAATRALVFLVIVTAAAARRLVQLFIIVRTASAGGCGH
jgi:hypothetical protein